jgi:hypothetical protein
MHDVLSKWPDTSGHLDDAVGRPAPALPIDEYAVQQLKDFDGKEMKSVTEKGLITDERIAAGPLLHSPRH